MAETSTPFDYSGPLTESVLLGCLATRFPEETLEWDAAKLVVTNNKDANALVRRRYQGVGSAGAVTNAGRSRQRQTEGFPLPLAA